MLTNCFWAWSLPWGGWYARHGRKWIFLRLYHLQKASWWGGGTLGSFPFIFCAEIFVWFESVQVLCMLPQSPWVHMRFFSCLFGDPWFFGVLHPRCFLPPLLLFYEPWGEGIEGDIPFRTKCFEVSVSLCIMSGFVSLSLFLSSKEGSFPNDQWIRKFSFNVADWHGSRNHSSAIFL